MSHRVANANSFRAAANRGRVKRANSFRVCARGVFSDVHHRHAFTDGKRHGFFSQFQQLIERPVFRKKSYRGGTDEGAGFDRNTSALRNFDDRQDVVAVRARGAVWTNLQFLLGDFAGHQLHAGGMSAARAGQSDVGGVDAERIHQDEAVRFSVRLAVR